MKKFAAYDVNDVFIFDLEASDEQAALAQAQAANSAVVRVSLVSEIVDRGKAI